MHGWVMRRRRRWRVDDCLFSPLFNDVARLGPYDGSDGEFLLACEVG